MASRIKGITVEIGGDTTGLDKALKNVNSTIKTTQSSLRDVNKLLKLDPTNANLLSQKQKMLKESIGATKEELDSLRQAQEQAKQQLENGDLGQEKYDALQREIVETEQELKRLQEEAAASGTAVQNIAQAGEKVKSAGQGIASVGKGLTTGVTVPLVAAGTVATAKFSEVDKTMQLTNATMGNSKEQAELLNNAMKEAAANSTFGMSDAANATLNFARAGLSAEEAAAALAPAMNLAAGEGGDLNIVSGGLVATINGFHGSFDDASHYADVFAAACNNSALDVNSLSEAMSIAAPIFSAAGYSVDDAALYMGVMANKGIDANTAATSLKTGLARLVSPAKDGAAMMDQLGISVTNADGSMKDSSTVQKELHDAFSKLSESEQIAAASAIFGKNQMAPWLALINTAPEDVGELSDSLKNCSGTTDEMAKAIMGGFGGSIGQLKSQIDVLMTTLGELLAKYLTPIIKKISDAINWLQNLSPEMQDKIIKIGLIAAAIGPLLLVIGKLMIGVGQLMTYAPRIAAGLTKVKAAFAALSGPVVAIVAIIVVLVAAFIHLWNTNDGFREAIISTWNRIVETFTGFTDGIVERLNALGFNFQSFGEVVSTIWNGFTELLAPVFENAFNAIAAILEGALNIITGIFDIFAGLFTGNWDQFWNGIKEVFSSIWTAISGVFTSVWNAIVGVTNTVLGWFGTNWNEVWSSIKSFFEGIWNGIVSFFTCIWNTITSVVTGAINGVRSVITSVFNAVRTAVTNIWNGIRTTISSVVNGIRTTISTVFNTVKSTVSGVFNSIKSTATSVWNGIKNAIVHPIETARDMIRSIVERIKGFFSGLHIQLPHIKLPHFSISGSLSIAPPRVPHLSIDWYKEGGIMTSPTIFGMNGSSLMAGGEAGAEAILPLKGFYNKLESMFAARDTALMEKYLAVIAGNSEKEIVLDSGQLVGAIAPKVDAALGKRASFAGRRMK